MNGLRHTFGGEPCAPMVQRRYAWLAHPRNSLAPLWNTRKLELRSLFCPAGQSLKKWFTSAPTCCHLSGKRSEPLIMPNMQRVDASRDQYHCFITFVLFW